jgi:hypothetical protein
MLPLCNEEVDKIVQASKNRNSKLILSTITNRKPVCSKAYCRPFPILTQPAYTEKNCLGLKRLNLNGGAHL